MVAGKQERQEGHRDKVDLPGHVPTDLLPPAKPYHSVSAAVYQKVTPLMELFILTIQLLHEAPPLDPTARLWEPGLKGYTPHLKHNRAQLTLVELNLADSHVRLSKSLSQASVSPATGCLSNTINLTRTQQVPSFVHPRALGSHVVLL